MTDLVPSYDNALQLEIVPSGSINTIYPYLLKLWLPFLLYTAIELAFKGYANYFSTGTFLANAIIFTVAYLLRVVMEVTLLSQLTTLLAGGTLTIEQLWAIPFEKSAKVLFTRLLILIAFILPPALLTSIGGGASTLQMMTPTSSPNMGQLLTYAGYLLIIYAWIYFIIAWWYHTYFIVLENEGPVSALLKSFNLSKSHWWATLFTVVNAVIRGLVLLTVLSLGLIFLLGSIGVIASQVGFHAMDMKSAFALWAQYGGVAFRELVFSITFQGFIACVITAKFMQLRSQIPPL